MPGGDVPDICMSLERIKTVGPISDSVIGRMFGFFPPITLR